MAARPADPPVPDRHRVGVVVLGMHRSGTSALTWLLGRMGAALPGDPMPATGENAKGYWESVGLVAANEALLRAARSSWFDPRALDLSRVPPALLAGRLEAIRAALATGWGDASLLAIKDPRICRFTARFAVLLRDQGIAPRAILMLRPAAEVAGSLARRDGTISGHARLLWLRHMLAAERDSRELPRAIVHYSQLLADWRSVATQIAPLLGREGWQPGGEDAAAIDAFLDPALRHATGQDDATTPPELARLVADAERAFVALGHRDDHPSQTALDDVAQRLAAMPWLDGDIGHDELRHRRAPPVAPGPPGERTTALEPAAAPPPADAPPPPEPLPDPSGDAALIRGSGLFDADWYRLAYPDAAASALDPVDHYLREGAARGYRPNPLFDTAYYARQMARRAGQAGER